MTARIFQKPAPGNKYQTALDKARGYDQLATAMRQGYADTPRYPYETDPHYTDSLRQKAVQAIYGLWNSNNEPAGLGRIYTEVTAAIYNDPLWKTEWRIPSKRTVDRRVNETADPNITGPITPCIAISPGVYLPNPLRFEGQARTLLEALLGGR